MDLDDLRVFVKVAELASFTRAAEILGMPKARASLRLQALEAALGVRLLQRTTRTVRPTPDGEQLLPRARQLVIDADELAAMFQAGRALRITEDRFSTMAENAADLIGELDGSGRFVYVSPNCESLLGVPAETYIGQSVDDPVILQRLHPEDVGVMDQIAALPLASGVEAQIEYRFLHGDGSWRSFETRGRSSGS